MTRQRNVLTPIEGKPGWYLTMDGYEYRDPFYSSASTERDQAKELEACRAKLADLRVDDIPAPFVAPAAVDGELPQPERLAAIEAALVKCPEIVLRAFRARGGVIRVGPARTRSAIHSRRRRPEGPAACVGITCR
jgi:hypothetical protein